MDDTIKACHIMDEGVVEIDTNVELPYLKHIELRRLQPQHFGYQSWHKGMVIPDNWMKKIYKNDIYRDTDIPEREPEKITKEQKRLLKEFLDNRQDPPDFQTVTSFTPTPRDSLIDDLSRIQEDYTTVSIKEDEPQALRESDLEARRKSKDSILNSDNVVICAKHPIQPESIIVGRAIEKVRRASDYKYKQLLKDEHFMKFLNEHIGRYVNNIERYQSS